MKAMNAVKRYGAKIAVPAALMGLALPASADNIWDSAVTELTKLVTGVGAIGAVMITLAVTVVGFIFFKTMVKRTP